MSFYLKVILLELLLKIISINSQSNFNSHNIIDQYIYYKDKKFNNTFIDFMNYKIYNIDKNNIIHKRPSNNNFYLKWKIEEINGTNKISIECANEICLNIDLSEHKVISFDFDKLLSIYGSIFAYILIIYGFFSLKRGFIYMKLSFIFYGSFAFVLFVRELCQLLEIIGCLNTLHKNAETLVYIIFYSTLVISILYGFVCHFSNIIKFITLGFIEGLMISKIIFYLLVFFGIFNNNLILIYFLIIFLFCIGNMVLFGYLKNKFPKINIINISLVGGFGIVFGINIINGGLPFLPYLILSSEYKENFLYESLLNNNILGYYASLLFILIICGFFWNKASYDKLKSRKLKSK